MPKEESIYQFSFTIHPKQGHIPNEETHRRILQQKTDATIRKHKFAKIKIKPPTSLKFNLKCISSIYYFP